jgi:hypothetical protein
LRSVFATIAFIIAISALFCASVSPRVSASSIEYYLSGIIVGTNKATYVCGEQVRALATLFSGNVTVPNFAVSIRIWAPSGETLHSGSTITDDHGVAGFSFLLPWVCEIGAHDVTVSSQGKYDSVNAYAKFWVSSREDYISLAFDKAWYSQGESVDLTGQLFDSCNLTLVNTQPVQLYLYGLDNGFLTSASTRTAGPSFALTLSLSESAVPGLYNIAVFALSPCANKGIYGNAFFSVLSNVLVQPWEISIALDRSTYLTGDEIVMSGMVIGGPYFFCQLGWACSGSGSFPSVDVSIQFMNANGTEVYSTSRNVGLYYYPPGYAFHETFSGVVGDGYLAPGAYIVIATVSSAGYPTVETGTSFNVASS